MRFKKLLSRMWDIVVDGFRIHDHVPENITTLPVEFLMLYIKYNSPLADSHQAAIAELTRRHNLLYSKSEQ